MKRKSPSEETKNKIRKSLIGHFVSDETKKKQKENHKGMLGKYHSKETIKKMSLAKKGLKRPPMSEEWKKKLSEAGKGRYFSIETRKKLSLAQKGNKKWLGKHHSIETKQRMSLAKKGKKISNEHKKKISNFQKGRIGEKSNAWKGDKCITPINMRIRKSFEYKIWRKSVFERDNYRCVLCGKIGGKLNAHHIKSFAKYSELRFDINNGITMCEKCHKIGRKKNPLFYQN